jgi:hypothetical protein
MSIDWVDYIPFDYQRYSQEILPAIEQATQDNPENLYALLQSATSFAFSPLCAYVLPLPAPTMERFIKYSSFQGLLDVSTLRRLRSGESCNPWEYMASIIPTIKGRTMLDLGRYGGLLLQCLFYSFCLDLPLSTIDTHMWTNDHPLTGNEGLHGWMEYCARDEETKTLWNIFRSEPPEELQKQLYLTDTTSNHSAWSLRAITIGDDTITGFITREEIEHLLTHVHTGQAPLLDTIISGCIRDGEGVGWSIDINQISSEFMRDQREDENDYHWHYSEQELKYIHHMVIFNQWMNMHEQEMHRFLDRYYQALWKIEDTILHRMRCAVEHGWGMALIRS